MRKMSAASAVLAGASGLIIAIPTAHAEQMSATHIDTNSVFTRTVNNTTPQVGQTVTYTQHFATTRGNDHIYDWKNNTDACLKYIKNSAKLQVGNGELQSIPEANVKVEEKTATITSTDAKGYWTFSAEQPHSFTLDYRVSPDCTPQQRLESGFSYTYRTGLFGASSTYIPNKFAGGPAMIVADSSKLETSVTLGRVENEIAVGKPVKLQATIAANSTTEGAAGDVGELPSLLGKNIAFLNGSQQLCDATVGEGGVATCDWTPEAPGSVAIKAVFSGDEDYLAASSEAQTVRVLKAFPKAPTGLRVSPAPITSAVHSAISGTGSPGAFVEALAPGGNRCVATAAEDGAFSCALGYLPAGNGQQITVTEKLEGKVPPAATVTVDVDSASRPDGKGPKGSALVSSWDMTSETERGAGNIWQGFLGILGMIGEFLRGLFR